MNTGKRWTWVNNIHTNQTYSIFVSEDVDLDDAQSGSESYSDSNIDYPNLEVSDTLFSSGGKQQSFSIVLDLSPSEPSSGLDPPFDPSEV